MTQLTHKELTQDDIDLYFFYRHHGLHAAFFKRYFSALPKQRTNAEAFNYVNDEYFTLFSEYKYSCYRSFSINLKKYLKNEAR